MAITSGTRGTAGGVAEAAVVTRGAAVAGAGNTTNGMSAP